MAESLGSRSPGFPVSLCPQLLVLGAEPQGLACGLVEPAECGRRAGEDGGLWERGAGLSLDVGPSRRGFRLQAHLGLGLGVRYLCFVTSDHKQSGSKDACFLALAYCGRSSAWGLGRRWSSWAVISSENKERLPGHVVIGKMQLLMAAGGRSHTLEGCQLGTAQPLASWPPP